jgi:hypothetical protein
MKRQSGSLPGSHPFENSAAATSSCPCGCWGSAPAPPALAPAMGEPMDEDSAPEPTPASESACSCACAAAAGGGGGGGADADAGAPEARAAATAAAAAAAPALRLVLRGGGGGGGWSKGRPPGGMLAVRSTGPPPTPSPLLRRRGGGGGGCCCAATSGAVAGALSSADITSATIPAGIQGVVQRTWGKTWLWGQGVSGIRRACQACAGVGPCGVVHRQEAHGQGAGRARGARTLAWPTQQYWRSHHGAAILLPRRHHAATRPQPSHLHVVVEVALAHPITDLAWCHRAVLFAGGVKIVPCRRGGRLKRVRSGLRAGRGTCDGVLVAAVSGKQQHATAALSCCPLLQGHPTHASNSVPSAAQPAHTRSC